MEKKKNRSILNIHTHNQASCRHAIINYSLLAASPVHVPHTDRVEEQMALDIMFQSWMTRPSSSLSILDMANINMKTFEKRCVYSVGIHPWELTEDGSKTVHLLSRLCALSSKKQVVAIGEAGLDNLISTPMELQTNVFRLQIQLSEQLRKPLIIHCVKAMEELLQIRKKTKPKQPWIWHGFRGKPEQAEQLLKQGFYLSFGEYYQDEAMIMMPPHRLFLETDDAKIDIECILQQAARTRGVEPDALRETICENTQNVFFNR